MAELVGDSVGLKRSEAYPAEDFVPQTLGSGSHAGIYLGLGYRHYHGAHSAPVLPPHAG